MTGCGKICILVCTSPVVDGHNVLNLKKIGDMVLVDGLISTYTSFGEMVLVDGLISTYTSGELESMTLQIEDFIPPDHTRANNAE